MAKFRAPMQAIRFAEGDSKISDQIQLFRTGTFYHDEYGQFQITPEMLKKMLSNFEKGIRGIDIAIDYKHASDDIAAAWIKSLFLSQDGNELWAEVEWTPKGSQVTQDKEFRYISPEFTYDYEDNESLKSFGPTLLGAGLTNRPTIKRMDPVAELAESAPADSERAQLEAARESRSKKYGIGVSQDSALTPPAGQPTDESKYGDPVNYKFPFADAAQAGNARVRFKQFANDIYKQDSSKAKVHERIVKAELAMGVTPDFDPKDALDALLPSSVKSQLQKPKSKGVKAMDYKAMDPAALDQMSPEELKATCLDLLKQVQAAAGDQKAMADKVAAMESDKKLAEKKSAFTRLLAEGKAVPAQEQAFIEGDMGKFAELSQKLNLSEQGSNAAGSKDKTVQTREEAELRVLELAEEKLRDKKAQNKGEAVSMVLKEHKDLQAKIYG